MEEALGNRTAETIEDKLSEAFDVLYQEYVDDEQRASIEAKIECEEAADPLCFAIFYNKLKRSKITPDTYFISGFIFLEYFVIQIQSFLKFFLIVLFKLFQIIT